MHHLSFLICSRFISFGSHLILEERLIIQFYIFRYKYLFWEDIYDLSFCSVLRSTVRISIEKTVIRLFEFSQNFCDVISDYITTYWKSHSIKKGRFFYIFRISLKCGIGNAFAWDIPELWIRYSSEIIKEKKKWFYHLKFPRHMRPIIHLL